MPVAVAGVASVLAASAFEETIQRTLDSIVYQRSLLSYETRHMRVEKVPTADGAEQVLVIRIKSPTGEVAKRVPLISITSVTIANEENHTFTVTSTILSTKVGGVGRLTLRVNTHALLMTWVNGLRGFIGEAPLEPTIEDFSAKYKKPAKTPSRLAAQVEEAQQQGTDVQVVHDADDKPPDDRAISSPPPELDMWWKFPVVLLLMTALTVSTGHLRTHGCGGAGEGGDAVTPFCLTLLSGRRALRVLAAFRHGRCRRAEADRIERLRGARTPTCASGPAWLPPPPHTHPTPLHTHTHAPYSPLYA